MLRWSASYPLPPLFIFALLCFFALFACLNGAFAATSDPKEIESITVLADSRLALPLAELATLFTPKSMVSVSGVFGSSAAHQKKIEDGDTADMFVTADKERIEQLKTKGLIDIYSIRTVASENGTHYTAAVVASENMPAARAFLKFLKTEEAKNIFRRNGLTAP